MKICAVMITCNRGALAADAIRCFDAQTHADRQLFILDTSPIDGDSVRLRSVGTMPPHVRIHREPYLKLTIGSLRNLANSCACAQFQPDAIAHWDDDDLSYPGRMEEQAAMLEGHDAAGYSSMVFSDCRRDPPENWLYSAAFPEFDVAGTSLMYWADTWKQNRFEDIAVGEDGIFTAGLKLATASGHLPAPKMIARIHGGNTTTQNFAGWTRWNGGVLLTSAGSHGIMVS